jgi:hypothetical protein
MSSSPSQSATNLPRLLRATYLAEGEKLLRETRATGLFYFPGPILYLLVVAPLDYAAAALKYGWAPFPYLTNSVFARFGPLGSIPATTYLTIFFDFLLLLGVLWLLVNYLRWIRTVYAVTNFRVIIQKGIVGRDFEEIPIPQVRGVDVHQSILQRILHYGTVTVSSESGSSGVGNEDWYGIPRPFEFQRLIEGANQNLAMRRASA